MKYRFTMNDKVLTFDSDKFGDMLADPDFGEKFFQVLHEDLKKAKALNDMFDSLIEDDYINVNDQDQHDAECVEVNGFLEAVEEFMQKHNIEFEKFVNGDQELD